MRPTTTGHPGLDPLTLDPSTAGRLLDGLAADDAPAAYAPVARVLAAAAAPAMPEELVGESAAVAAFAAVGPRPSPAAATTTRGSVWDRKPTKKVAAAVAAFVGGLTLTTGLAAAGALPGAAQGVAEDALSVVGIDVPGPNDAAGDHPHSRGTTGDAPTASDPASPDPSTTGSDNGDNGNGAEVSETARTTDAEGRDKGAEVSGVASDGKSRADEGGAGAPADPGAPADEHKPADPGAAPVAPAAPAEPEVPAPAAGKSSTNRP